MKPPASACALLSSFWQAPGVADVLRGVPAPRVVMMFICMDGYSKLLSSGHQDVAEKAVELFKLCVRQARPRHPLMLPDSVQCCAWVARTVAGRPSR